MTLAKIRDGVAISIKRKDLYSMGQEAALKLEAHSKQTILAAGMDWEFQEDPCEGDIRIIPRNRK